MGDDYLKKLLFITWSVSYGYGTEKSLADIINRMDKERFDIDVLPLFKNSNNTMLNDNIHILEPLVDYTKENHNYEEDMEYYYFLLSNPREFNKLIKKQYDCIIATNHNAPSYFASYIKNTSKVVWIRGDLSELDYRNFNNKTLEYSGAKREFNTQKEVFEAFDNIVVISNVVKRNLTNNFGITDNIWKIPNSLDVEKINNLSKLEVDTSKKVIFTTIGRLDVNKNQILLLEAANILKNKSNNFMIYLIGDGEERTNLERYIKEHHLEEYVKILGFKDNPYPYIRKSRATILTSFSEGFSLALAESVLLDTPIISTDVGIAQELIEKYNCGTLINYDKKELASVLYEYINKENNKHFNIGNEFNLQTELERTVEVILDTIKKKKKNVN
jgi:glycosyltransferase involved in cell wall biosynthesis